MLVDYTGRLFREGKTAISAELAGILARLGTSAEGWQARLEKLRGGHLLGRFFAARRELIQSTHPRPSRYVSLHSVSLQSLPLQGAWRGLPSPSLPSDGRAKFSSGRQDTVRNSGRSFENLV